MKEKINAVQEPIDKVAEAKAVIEKKNLEDMQEFAKGIDELQKKCNCTLVTVFQIKHN